MRPDSSIARSTGYRPANPPGQPSPATDSRVSTPYRCSRTPAAACSFSVGPAPDPDHLAHRHELVEEPWVVPGDATGDDVALDHAGGQRAALQLEDDLEQTVDTACSNTDAVPRGEEAGQRLGRNGLDFATQSG